ncbi:hypothetical protein D9M71_173430 [compost metagenome]
MGQGVALQRPGRADIAAATVCGEHLFRQATLALQTEVEAMCGNRMHAHCRVTDQRTARPGETFRIDANQRIDMPRAQQTHAAQAPVEATLDLAGEGFLAHLLQRCHLPLRQGQHYRGTVAIQRQQGQRLAIAEPLPGHLLVRALMRHAADQHGLAEILHARADAEHAPGFRETAVGRYQQSRIHLIAIGQRQPYAIALHLQCGDSAFSHQSDIGTLGHRRIGRPANRLVRHQIAQLLRVRLAGLDPQGEQRGTIEHLGIAQRRDILGGDPRPQAERLHLCARGMGERDLAAVFRRIGQRGEWLAVDQQDRQAVSGQRAGQAQSRRPGADDGNVHVHWG